MRQTRVRMLCGALLACVAFAVAAAPPGRQPVLGQIDLPHAYYFREMYLPQLTGGPSSVSFAPDGREVVYSMAGSLWRQRLDSGTAVQLTDGPGYDYQPDWSPDGRSIVYVTYRGDALELARLDLASGESTLLTKTGAINVEPRFSPDGRRLVWVSTVAHRRFHLSIADIGSAGLEHVEVLTTENKSPLRRYYYSAYDHEINPVWTRDGKSIVFVSNRGHIHGTGGFWQMEAHAGAPAREIHYEETNWRARPDFSPDGKRMVYSSYLGRNGHQLWLMPAEGGDALPVSYGDWDEVGVRWSPDGSRFAFISNRSGGLELWLQDVAAGAQTRVEIGERRWLTPHARLRIEVRDAAGRTTPARVSVTDARGRFHAPAGAWIHGDDGFDRAERPFEAHYFHTRGDDVVEVPAGEVRIEVLQGFTRPLAVQTLQLAAGEERRVETKLAEGYPMTTAGGHWVGGDAHVHMNYGGLYRNTPAHLLEQAEAEDLGLVNALIVNKEQRVPDIVQSGRGRDPLSSPEHVVMHGQEFHTSYWGHLGLIGLRRGTLLPGYAGYPNTAVASLAPMNADVAERAHAGGALVGYVHPFDETPHPFDATEALSNELPVDVALGKVDYIEVLGFSDHRTTAEVWYRLLNLGIRLPAAAGTDAMANYASLRGPVGMNRVYVATPGATVDPAAWMSGLRAGRTFATNGPLLDFTLDGVAIGGDVSRVRGGNVPFTARLRSIVPLDHLEVVCNGRVVRDLPLTGTRMAADVTGTIPLKDSGWCLLRASADRAEHPVLDLYPYATTSPVYLRVGHREPSSPADAAYFVAWIDRVIESTDRYPDWNSPEEKAGVLARLREAQRWYAARR